jgi:hypothetical protein
MQIEAQFGSPSIPEVGEPVEEGEPLEEEEPEEEEEDPADQQTV